MAASRRPNRWVILAAAGVTALALGGCGGGGGGGGGGTVGVTLQEFSVIPDESSISSGKVTFDVTNEGPNEVHELVVLKTDLAADALPTNSDGSADEEGAGVEPIDEIEDLAVGDSRDLTVDLQPGHYVLVCNIVSTHEGEVEAHYKLGMRAEFTVT
jgi:uncharacterized cupredoxin-like copper-binding protein